MRTRVSLADVLGDLENQLPEWRQNLVPEAEWVEQWQAVSGCSRATAYRMHAAALEIDTILFERFRAQHPEIPAERIVEEHNRHYGIPCPWLEFTPRYNSSGQRVAA